jgi:hypothetical protein
MAKGRVIRAKIAELEAAVHAALGTPTVAERLASWMAVGLAAWTGLTLRLGLFQHPRLVRRTFRVPNESLPSRVWRRLRGLDEAGHQVEVELRNESTVWVTVAGTLNLEGAERLTAGLLESLRRRKERLVLDLGRLAQAESEAIEHMAERLREYADRVRVLVAEGPAPMVAPMVMEG